MSTSGKIWRQRDMLARVACRFALVAWATLLAGSANGQAVFQDKSAALKLQAPNAAGCWADLDNDGWVDLCVSGSVWKNEAGKGFRNVFAAGSSVAADFDNDGHIDLFSWSSLKLYRNLGAMKFEEVPLPTLPKTVSRGACWGDLNGDGFVDLFVGGYEDWNAGVTWPFLILNAHSRLPDFGQQGNAVISTGLQGLYGRDLTHLDGGIAQALPALREVCEKVI